MSSDHLEPELILSQLRKHLHDNFDKIVEALTKQKTEEAIKRLISAMPYVFPNGNKELHTSTISGNEATVVTPDGDDDSSDSDETRTLSPIDISSVNDGDDNDSSDSDMDNRALSPLYDSSSDDDEYDDTTNLGDF